MEKEEESKKDLEKFWKDRTNELAKDEKIKTLTTQKRDLEDIVRLLKEEGGCVTISDDVGNKKMVKGTIDGFSVRQTTSSRRNIAIHGLDKSWLGKKVLLVLLE